MHALPILSFEGFDMCPPPAHSPSTFPDQPHFRQKNDRARKIFSTPALWHQKVEANPLLELPQHTHTTVRAHIQPSSQENGDGHSLLHLEQAPPSNSPPEPSLPALTSGGTAATIQTSRAKSMTAPVASPRVAGTTAAPVPTLNRISSTAALPPRGTTPSAHSHLVSATRSTPAVHAEQSHPLVGRTSWLALNAPSNGTPAIDHRPQCPNNGPLAPEDSGAVLPPLIPQHSGPSTKAFPAVSARFCLDISSRSQQSPSVFSTSPPLSAVLVHIASCERAGRWTSAGCKRLTWAHPSASFSSRPSRYGCPLSGQNVTQGKGVRGAQMASKGKAQFSQVG
eukprot:814870-Pelagomonas_calceolata.AAC.2